MGNSSEHPEHPDGQGIARPGRPRFQFGIRTLLWATLGVALICSVLFALPPLVSVPVMWLCTIAFPAVLTTVLVYGDRDQRAFSIGALFPSGILMGWLLPFGDSVLLNMLEVDDREPVFWLGLFIILLWISSIVIGLLCAWACRTLERRKLDLVGNSSECQPSVHPED